MDNLVIQENEMKQISISWSTGLCWSANFRMAESNVYPNSLQELGEFLESSVFSLNPTKQANNSSRQSLSLLLSQVHTLVICQANSLHIQVPVLFQHSKKRQGQKVTNGLSPLRRLVFVWFLVILQNLCPRRAAGALQECRATTD